MRLFISYAHDNKELVEQSIVSLLRAAGHDPWYDYHLLPGQDWQAELLNVITTCDALVYVMTPSSVKSEWCRWEVAKAIELDKPVVPVLLQAAKLPRSMRSIQYVDFTQGVTGETAARLVGGLQKLSLHHAPAAPANPAGTPTRPAQTDTLWTALVKRFQWPWAALAAAILIGVIAGGIALFGGDSNNPDDNGQETPVPTPPPGDYYLHRSAETVAVCAMRSLDLSALKLDFGLNTRHILGDVFSGSAAAQVGDCWCLQACDGECDAPVPPGCQSENTQSVYLPPGWDTREVRVSLNDLPLGTCPARPESQDFLRCYLFIDRQE
jgi:hypothetical protein